jgi:adenylylsulfate kinase-like enzyme
MVDAGLIVLVSFISPFKRERSMARALFDDDEFTEVFVDAPIEECERRDVKVLYAKARAGTVKQFTGIDSPYERPETPDLVVNTVGMSWESCAIKILAFLHARASEKDLKRLRRKERDFSLSK